MMAKSKAANTYAKAKAATKAKAPAKSKGAAKAPIVAAANGSFVGIKPGSKAEMLLGIVTAKDGATKPAMLKALGGWKGCGNYLAIACTKAGLKLERRKVDGETRWVAAKG